VFTSGHFYVLGMRKPHFQCNANWEVATTSTRFCNEPHLFHVLFWRLHLAPPSHPGQSTTLLWEERPSSKWAQLHTVAPSNNKGSTSCSHYFCLFAALFFTHIPFVVNHTFTTRLTERLQYLQQGWLRLFETTESERDK